MSQTSVAQINARLPRNLKEAGDEGLRALGLSPTDAIRALWTRLSSGGEDLENVRAFLLGKDPDSTNPEIPFGQSDLAEGWRMVDASIMRLGIAAPKESSSWSSQDDNDMLAQALKERMQERGLM